MIAAVPGVLVAETAQEKFIHAETGYRSLQGNPAKQKYRHNWLNCIKKYQMAYDTEPTGPWAAAALFWAGKLYYEMAIRSGLEADRVEAKAIFERLIGQHHGSAYKARAEKELQRMSGADLPKAQPPVPRSPSPKSKPEKVRDEVPFPGSDAEKLQAAAVSLSEAVKTVAPVQSNSKLVTVSGLRFWSNPNYTRIVIDAERETPYEHRLLNKDPAIDKPQRLYVDLASSRLGKDFKKLIPINDDLLSDARAGQYTLESVRVVVDIKSFKTYKIFSLKNPFRIVIDVWGDAGSGRGPIAAAPAPDKKEKNFDKHSLARQLALGVRRIVVDPGHGGKDFGAPGYRKGVHEKDVVLDIAKRLAKKIRENLGCEVIMTRTRDQYLTLEERTAIANTSDADLFISIHTNSHQDKRAFGIETYFLNFAMDNDAILVAARENATSTKNISDLQTILNDLMNNAKVNESSRLAAHVQSAMHQGLSRHYDSIKDKGVKQAPFYVLLGAQMPAILVETAFISNERECGRLVTKAYQERVTDAIMAGVKKYIKEINPTVFMERNQKRKKSG